MPIRTIVLTVLTIAAVVGEAFALQENGPAIKIGAELPNDASLRDMRGSRRSLHSFEGYKATVVAFMGIRCPLANLYAPRLLELEKEYRSRGVKFVAVYPNESDALDAVARHAYDRDVPFLVLKDFRQRLADRLGLARTPGVAVLDGGLKLRYRGRIDDQYGAAHRKEKPGRKDLVRALEEVLEGKDVEIAETVVDGCLLSRESGLPKKPGVTYAKDVAPILQRRCQRCHRPGQIGPFPLLTYKDAVDSARMIREVVLQRRMPPWHADERYGKFSNDRHLELDEIAVIKSWVDSGMPEGDPKEAPTAKDWPKGWIIGTPDTVLSMPKEIDVPAEGVMPYMYFVTQPDFDGDRWVQRAEVRPGDASVLHHVLVYARMPGRGLYGLDGNTPVVAGWVPGDTPQINPPGTAFRIPKGAELVWEVHYTPNGTATKDRTSLGIIFAKEPPKRELRVNIFAKLRLKIPAGEPHHRHVHTMKFRKDALLMSLLPHMHVRGKHYRYEAVYPDGRTEVLLSVPRWDFNWQGNYWFEKPVPMPKGTVLRQIGHWDNSDNNPLNPDRTQEVKYGLQTWEEMFNGWAQYVWDEK